MDTGNNGQYSSVPAPSPILTNAPLTASQALAFATNDIAADAFLSIQPGFSNGVWDVGNATVVQYVSDAAGEGDWLIPYEGPGGTGDVTGFVMIDEETGDMDEAVWMNPSDVVASMSLAAVRTMENDEFLGIVPDDNVQIGQLSIQPGNTNSVALSWPALDLFTNALTIQQNSSLQNSNWVSLTNSPVTIAGQNQVVLPATGPQSFFRLMFSTTNTPPPPVTNGP